MEKTPKFDVCFHGKAELTEVFDYEQDGLVKPFIMWGCKLCKERLGISDFAIYNVWTPGGDTLFCSRHGFLTENQTFRRKRPRMSFKRNFLCL